MPWPSLSSSAAATSLAVMMSHGSCSIWLGRQGARRSQPMQAAATAVRWGACVTGSPGAGKSALFAKLVSELEHDPKVLLLANAAGTGPRSASVDAMLHRWIAELAAFVGVTDPLPERASVEEVEQTFASLLGRASVKQRVVVLLDAMNQFEPTPRAKHMTWRPKLWPPNARLIATTVTGTEAEAFEQWAGVEEIELRPLTEGDAREIGRGVWRRYHCPWSNAVWQTLAAKRLADDSVAAVGNPLWTTLACEQLALLDADDFTRAERQFADERDPQARLTQLRRDLAERMPPDLPGLYAWLLAQTAPVLGAAVAKDGFYVSRPHARKSLSGWRKATNFQPFATWRYILGRRITAVSLACGTLCLPGRKHKAPHCGGCRASTLRRIPSRRAKQMLGRYLT